MSDSKGMILGCGNPLLDISAEVPEQMLEKYQVKVNNAILAEDQHLPMYQELVDSYPVEYIAGGATQNSIRVCQWMLQIPGATSYIGSVGQDKFATQLKESAMKDGVDVHYHIDKDTPTGTCAVLIKDHERSLIANLAAANNYKQSHLNEPSVQPVWMNAKFIYIAGFFLTVSPPSIMQLAQHCHESDSKTFIMNLAAPFISQFFTQPLLEALPYCDIIIGNESEAKAFGEKLELSDTSPEAVCKHLQGMPKENSRRKRMAIITQGAHPTLVCDEQGQLTKYDVPAVPAEEMIDVNGAGDAFVGGFLAALAKEKPIPECIKAAHYSAGYIVRRSGCTLEGKPNYTI